MHEISLRSINAKRAIIERKTKVNLNSYDDCVQLKLASEDRARSVYRQMMIMLMKKVEIWAIWAFMSSMRWSRLLSFDWLKMSMQWAWNLKRCAFDGQKNMRWIVWCKSCFLCSLRAWCSVGGLIYRCMLVDILA